MESASPEVAALRGENGVVTSARSSRWFRAFRRAAIVLAVVYPIALIMVAAAMRFVGERWWPTTIALYLPRVGFALPLPILAAGLVVTRAYRWLWTQVAALLFVVFVLMGFETGLRRTPTAGATQLKLMTMNVGFGQEGIQRVLATVRRANADVVALEAVSYDDLETVKKGLVGYTVREVDEFVLASHFPLSVPDELPPGLRGYDVSAQYVVVTVTTPAGPLRVYAIHPTSPHGAIHEVRGDGLRSEIASGRILSPSSRAPIVRNATLRVAQVTQLMDDVRSGEGPFVVAGDTNLPGLSWAFANLLGDLHDAFAETGAGFGYTYPARYWTWLRLDRVLGGGGVRFLDARVVPERVSTHLPVLVELELTRRSD